MNLDGFIFTTAFTVDELTSKLYTKNSKSTDVEESQGTPETREARAESVRPLSQRIIVLVVILVPVVVPTNVSLPFACSWNTEKRCAIMKNQFYRFHSNYLYLTH